MSDTKAAAPDRSLIFIVATVAALVVIALIVVFVRGNAEPLDESTPAGVVQRYTQALIDGDDGAARALVSGDVLASCEENPVGGFEGMRVTLASTSEQASTADVNIVVTYTGDSGLFGTTGYQYDGTFRLIRDGGQWTVQRAPMEFAICMEMGL